jgi:hypothetical protein
MEIFCFSETLASTDESTRRQNPVEEHPHSRRRENLKSHKDIPCFLPEDEEGSGSE